MKTHSKLIAVLGSTAALLILPACSPDHSAEAEEAFADAGDAIENSWSNFAAGTEAAWDSFAESTFEQRNEFARAMDSMADSLDHQIDILQSQAAATNSTISGTRRATLGTTPKPA